MAVEARHHMNLFPNQLISNREFMKSSNPGPTNNYIMYNWSQLETGVPYLNDATIPETPFPFYQSLDCENPTSANNKMSVNNNKADSGLTYHVPSAPCNVGVGPRKRPRGPDPDLDALLLPGGPSSQKPKLCSGLSSFVDGDVLSSFQQQHLEIDRFISEHNEKVRMELEERRRKQLKMLVMSVQEVAIKKLIEKEEELQRMGKLNWALQERVKSLYLETQVWKDLAHTNEATANSLRSNLEQVLAHFTQDRHVSSPSLSEESSCGSSDHPAPRDQKAPNKGSSSSSSNRVCNKCGERESSVLLLPCRHLCLCTLCGSTSVGNCPLCDSVMTATVHVNMS